MKRLIVLSLSLLLFCGTVLAADYLPTQFDQAAARGEITAEEALLYKALCVVAPAQLPSRWRSLPGSPQKCATSVMLELSRQWPTLSQQAKTILSPYIIITPDYLLKDPQLRQKTTYQTSLPNSYQTTNFNIEWGTVTPTISEWQDGNLNGRPDYIDNLASYLETSWSAEMDTLHLKNPAQTSTYLFNVYVANTGNGAPSMGSGYYGYTTIYPNDPGLNGPANMAYVVMNDDYTGFPANDDPEGSFKGAVKVTVAHEFFHASQFAYDINEAGWIMELSSTWVEDYVFDTVNDYYNYLTGSGGWQMYPETSLTYFNGMHEYGNVIFGKYLSETYPTVNVMREIWELLDDTSGDNAATALETFFHNQTPATTLTAAFNDFTAKNAVMDYTEGANYGGYNSDKMYYQEQISTYPVFKQYTTALPDYLGSNYVNFTSAAAPQTLQLNFNGDVTFNGNDVTWSAAAVAVNLGTSVYQVNELTLDSNGDGTVSVSGFGTGGTYDKVYFVCRVLSATGVTPAENSGIDYGSYPNGVPYTLTASLGGVTVSPLNATVEPGKTQQFTAAGGTAPYTWDTSDHGVGTIDASGLFTAVAAGTCSVFATDATQTTGTSGTITVAVSPAETKDQPDVRKPPSRVCFIATAAYGTPLADEVGILCEFRDAYLVPHAAGRWFVKNYYRFSPPLATFITKYPLFRAATRLALQPLLCLAVFLLYPGWAFKILFLLASLLLIGSLTWQLRRVVIIR